MNVILFFLGAVILGAGIWYVVGLRVGRSRLEVQNTGGHFPAECGYNLQRDEQQVPEDFAGRWNLLIVPFQREQQRDVNTWIPPAQKLEAAVPGFMYYELPTISRLPTLSRTFINEGMRAGIPDSTARTRTITLYIDKAAFKEALGITSEDSIHLFLVDQEGEILWRERGRVSEDALGSLQRTLEKLSG